MHVNVCMNFNVKETPQSPPPLFNVECFTRPALRREII